MEVEKQLYREARKEDALLYIAMICVIFSGFYLFPIFSLGSAIATLTLLFWCFGIGRMGKNEIKYLLEIEPELNRLKSTGLSEHEAMIELGCDKFYYKPFWSIR